MDRIRLVEHRGKSILLIDVSGCSADEACDLFLEDRKAVAACGPSSALTLTDVTATKFDNRLIETVKETIRLNEPNVNAAAVVGVEGLQKIIFAALTTLTGRNLQHFPNREKALDWLASQ